MTGCARPRATLRAGFKRNRAVVGELPEEAPTPRIVVLADDYDVLTAGGVSPLRPLQPLVAMSPTGGTVERTVDVSSLQGWAAPEELDAATHEIDKAGGDIAAEFDDTAALWEAVREAYQAPDSEPRYGARVCKQ